MALSAIVGEGLREGLGGCIAIVGLGIGARCVELAAGDGTALSYG